MLHILGCSSHLKLAGKGGMGRVFHASVCSQEVWRLFWKHNFWCHPCDLEVHQGQLLWYSSSGCTIEDNILHWKFMQQYFLALVPKLVKVAAIVIAGGVKQPLHFPHICICSHYYIRVFFHKSSVRDCISRVSRSIVNIKRKFITLICCDALALDAKLKQTIISIVHLCFLMYCWYDGRSTSYTGELIENVNGRAYYYVTPNARYGTIGILFYRWL